MNRLEIIKHFVFCEFQQNRHSEEYLEAISSEEYLEDLIDVVALWVRECEGNREKAALYILTTMDEDYFIPTI
jgi:hypothetical protein